MNAERQSTREGAVSASRRSSGEAARCRHVGGEVFVAVEASENLAGTDGLMEAVCERSNMVAAYRRVVSNKGSAGVDGMSVGELRGYLKRHWPEVKQQLLEGRYQAQAVKAVDIRKPDGGIRTLGIPVVLDRMIQQAILQVLQPLWEPTFSAHSYGFRPGRSTHQAIAQARQYVTQGYRWVVDIDLEKFFDRVHHDRLMSRLAERIRDKRMLRLVRSFLNAGILRDGLMQPRHEGTPQGGPLSPFLSNVVLDELDKELERRGLRFVRYADDCNIYVASKRAAERVMDSVSSFISKRLKLRVNLNKSAADYCESRKFLGVNLMPRGKETRVGFGEKSTERFKRRIRKLTRPTKGTSIDKVIRELSVYLRGWYGYFRIVDAKRARENLDGWVRRRVRALAWRQWKTPQRREEQLRTLGVSPCVARTTSQSSKGPWHLSTSQALCIALSTKRLSSMGLFSINI
jgi:RNA-directed DNA polymerase